MLQNLQTAKLKLDNEWVNNKFIKDIFVVDGDRSCQDMNSKAEVLFSYNWQGLQPYYRNKEDEFTLKPDNGASKRRVYYEMVSPGFPMVQASNFGGYRICATKMDIGFKDVQLVKGSKNCKPGFR